jgi:hypothetical protein
MTDRNRRVGTLLSGCALALAAVLSAAGAQAQQPERGQSVFERPRPDYEPLGVRAGGFVLFPQVELGEAYNDNIFADPDDEEDDFITVLSPEVAARSDWGRHALNLRTGADAGFYLDNDDENFLDGFALVDGRLDVVRETYIFGGLGWRHRHEDRGSPDDVRGEEPTEYDLYSANLGVFRGRGRISARVNGNVDRFDFHDVDAAGGTEINQDDRDRFQYVLSGQVGYEYLPETEAFVRVTGRVRNYDQISDTGIDRDSLGYAAVVGTDLDFTGKVSGEVFVGYQHTTYDDEVLNDIDGLAAGAAVLWNITGLTSLRGTLDVTTEETTQAGASGFLSTRAGAAIEHELMRNVLLGAGVTLGRDDYEGIDRQDDILIGSLTARYLINRNFYAGAELTHRTRESDFSAADFSQNVILFRLGAQL